MNLLLRLLKLIFVSSFKSKLALLDESTVKFRVYPHDLDINFHMTNSRYCSLMDLGRLDLILRGPYANLFRKREWQSVLGGISLRFRRPLHLFESFELRTRIIGWDEKWFFIEQIIVKDEDVKCVALAKCLLLNKNKAVSTEELFHTFASELTLPSVQITPKIRHWLDYESETHFPNPNL